MHTSAYKFVKRHIPSDAVTVVEVGSRNINGSVRQLLPKASWWGIDVMEGRDVDEVADGTTWTPEGPVDLAICCEVFEHTNRWRDIISNMVSWLRPEGTIILTCAGPGRPEHSAITGGPLQPEEWYENIEPYIMEVLLDSLGVETLIKQEGADLYVVGVKRS